MQLKVKSSSVQGISQGISEAISVVFLDVLGLPKAEINGETDQSLLF